MLELREWMSFPSLCSAQPTIEIASEKLPVEAEKTYDDYSVWSSPGREMQLLPL